MSRFKFLETVSQKSPAGLPRLSYLQVFDKKKNKKTTKKNLLNFTSYPIGTEHFRVIKSEVKRNNLILDIILWCMKKTEWRGRWRLNFCKEITLLELYVCELNYIGLRQLIRRKYERFCTGINNMSKNRNKHKMAWFPHIVTGCRH